ncbi:NAD-P-binding protein [Cyathus striatus]|nr:NAD-P-binding protein [Cyathus striatus]
MPSSKINLAVAGVTSGLGNAIATALVNNPSITVTLLTRTSTSTSVPKVLEPLVHQGAIIRAVDYASVKALTDALNGVHTVISTLFTPQDTTPTDNLLKAAIAAGVTRFAPSEFAIAKEGNSVLQVYSTKISHWEAVKASGLEYTAFRNGMFMDYLAAGSSYTGPLRIAPFVVNVKERKAEIPGTGDDKVTFTTLADIGKFVSAAVTLEKWPEEMGMSGETLTYNEIVRKAEEVLGEKISVTYINVDNLKKRKLEAIEKNDWWGKFLMELYLAFIEGHGEIKDPYLNKVLTTVQPTKVKDFLQKYWSME